MNQGEPIYTVDSLNFFRSVDLVFKKHTLDEIYKRRFGSFPVNSHDAENDVLNLIRCVVDVKFEFLDYTDNEAHLKKFI